MKIFHLTSWLSSDGGGIPPVIEALAHELQRGNHSCSVLGLRDKSATPEILAGRIDGACGAVVGPAALGYSPELRKMLAAQVTRNSVIHVHGLWMYPGLLARNLAAAKGASLVISPHGMLDEWALQNSRWKKRLAGFAYENRNLREAKCLQALCGPEAESIRAYGLKNPIAIIPNGVDLVDAETLKTEKLKSEKKMLLFLGRLHPKKGLPNALRAWSSHSKFKIQHSKFDEWQFVIAGWDQGGHEADLKKLCDELDLAYADIPAAEFVAGNRGADSPTLRLPTPDSPTPDSSTPDSSTPDSSTLDLQTFRPLDSLSSDSPSPALPTPLGTSGRAPAVTPYRAPASVIFVGPAFDDVKDALLRRADAFILPSFSEGLPMSVLEAWSYQLPVLMTDHCNLAVGFAADAALRIGTDVESIAEGMRLLACSLPSELCSLGQNGRALVERQFTWPQVAAQMKEVYDWVLGGGPTPGCVEGKR